MSPRVSRVDERGDDGEIWVNADEAREWPPRLRFTIGHLVMHATEQQALFCRSSSVDESVETIEIALTSD